MMKDPLVSVILPTYKRAHLITHVLEALACQTYANFEVLVVLKPSGDKTEEILQRFSRILRIEVIIQKEGFVTDALNLGLDHVHGDIIAFLDDDAIPLEDWLQKHVATYEEYNVGGVAGNVVPGRLRGNLSLPVEGASEIIPEPNWFLNSARQILWNCPLEGLEHYMVFISRAGRVSYDSEFSEHARHNVTRSLLGMGANMSLLAEPVRDFRFPRTWILGLSWEQYIGWYVWKRRGYSLVFNPEAVVCHLIHNRSLSRFGKSAKREALSTVEGNLLFYRLRSLESNLSLMHRIVWLMYVSLENAKKICFNRELWRISWMRGTFLSETIGLKWLISAKFGGKYTPLADLKKILED
jgi:glycosyltransferase involved in cell wall biosynthesis